MSNPAVTRRTFVAGSAAGPARVLGAQRPNQPGPDRNRRPRHRSHPRPQIEVKDRQHPVAKHLAAGLRWEDECYYIDHLNPDNRPLLVTDPSKLTDPKGAPHTSEIPLAWYHEFEGGRQLYTALGHKKEDYANPILYDHIQGGLPWVIFP